jgi:PTS system nitrogen regulatory IIA component
MGNEIMDLKELATYLQRDLREVTRLASRGHLPGQKVSGQWRFHQAEINHWLETQLSEYSEEQLAALEARSARATDKTLLLSALMSEATTAVPLPANTRASVLNELIRLAEQSWQVFDAAALAEAVSQREEMGCTALPSGVALPHPRRPLPHVLGESILAFGRTAAGIPFGGSGALTDVFFLICCRDYPTHLQVMARLARLLLRATFLDELRGASNSAETLQVIETHEREVIGN